MCIRDRYQRRVRGLAVGDMASKTGQMPCHNQYCTASEHQWPSAELVGTFINSEGTTCYCIQMACCGNSSWTIEKRFSDFEELKAALEDSGVEIDSFPRKHLLRSNSTEVTRERRKGLDLFLQQVVLPKARNRTVHAFLQLDQPVLNQDIARVTSEFTGEIELEDKFEEDAAPAEAPTSQQSEQTSPPNSRAMRESFASSDEGSARGSIRVSRLSFAQKILGKPGWALV
eukprot:TRINITY_DN14657_c0_g1_i1.p1 TRINITY_DN14657_c0_g1~~TRINITY_DN14657_c0_g1_i1.p1  ORF type:complete len:229 (-),score=51.11 TRINITY_DN14657_c0_g1_i1:151-837(-)